MTPLLGAAAVIVGIVSLLASMGADSRWLAALGQIIIARDAIPHGVPFAAAPTAHWPNVVVLAEVLFDALERGFGDRGLMLAQLVAVAGAITLLARDALAAGANRAATAWTLLLASVGALPSLAVIRVQLFSLVLFPALVMILRAQARQPSRRIWFVVPLLALWSNLHGAVLVGLLVTLTYLALMRFREAPWTSLALAVAAPAAVCLTPAGPRTVVYYYGVLTNQAAARGQGLWGPLSFQSPFDVLLVAAVLGLAVQLLRASPPVWERVATVVLAILTVRASRMGVWLLFYLVPRAAVGMSLRRVGGRHFAPVGVAAVAVIVFAVIRGPLASGLSNDMVKRVIAIAHGAPVLAQGSLAEQVAMSGGRIWAGDPIDAFSKRDQASYLDWLEGRKSGLRATEPPVAAVLVETGSAASELMRGVAHFARLDVNGGVQVYVRDH